MRRGIVHNNPVQEKMKGDRVNPSQVIFGHGTQFFRADKMSPRVLHGCTIPEVLLGTGFTYLECFRYGRKCM